MRTPGRPLVVMSGDALFGAFPDLARGFAVSSELWVRGDPARIVPNLEARGFAAVSLRTVATVRSMPSLLSLGWTLQFLLALGVVAALVVGAALLLYLQARQGARDLSYSLARRMGLREGVHRRAMVLELGGMLLVASAVGAALALLAAALVRSKLDLLPGIPGPTVFAVPWTLFVVVAVCVVSVAEFGGRLAQRRARRARPSEVLRLA